MKYRALFEAAQKYKLEAVDARVVLVLGKKLPETLLARIVDGGKPHCLSQATGRQTSKPPSQWRWRFQGGGTAKASIALGDLPCPTDATNHDFVAFFTQIILRFA